MFEHKEAGMIRIGECNDEDERAQRSNEAKKFWKRLTSNELYLPTNLVLNESCNLLREALNCYQTCAYMATTLLCRSSVETAIYKVAIAENLKWTKMGRYRIWEFTYGDCYRYLQDYGAAIEKIKKKYPDIFKKISKRASNIRYKGNFVAHHAAYLDKHLEKKITESEKLWLDSNDARQSLEDTTFVLQVLMEALKDPEVDNDEAD